MEFKKKKSSPKKAKGMQLDVQKLKKYFTRNTLLGIALADALILVILYVLVFLNYTDKTEMLERQNEERAKEIAILEDYYRNMESYQAKVDELSEAIPEMLAQYPADVREEDIIMLAVQTQENNNIAYNSINMEAGESVYAIDQAIVQAAGIDGLDQPIYFTQKHAVYSNETDYGNLKNVIEQIYANDNRIGIDNIVYVKNDENAILEGNISLYFYSAQGTGSEYVAPDIAEYLSGTDDLFRLNQSRVVKDEAEQEEEVSEETEETTE